MTCLGQWDISKCDTSKGLIWPDIPYRWWTLCKKLMQKPSTEQAEQIQQHIKRIIHHDQVIRNHQGGWPKLPYMAVRGEQENKVVSKSFKTSEAKAQKSHTASAVDWGSEQVKRWNSTVRLIRVHPLMERWQSYIAKGHVFRNGSATSGHLCQHYTMSYIKFPQILDPFLDCFKNQVH